MRAKIIEIIEINIINSLTFIAFAEIIFFGAFANLSSVALVGDVGLGNGRLFVSRGLFVSREKAVKMGCGSSRDVDEQRGGAEAGSTMPVRASRSSPPPPSSSGNPTLSPNSSSLLSSSTVGRDGEEGGKGRRGGGKKAGKGKEKEKGKGKEKGKAGLSGQRSGIIVESKRRDAGGTPTLGASEYSLTSVASAPVGSPLSVLWTAPGAAPGDWIGLYPHGSPLDTGKTYTRNVRTLGSNAEPVGLFNFERDRLPGDPGEYVFRYHKTDSGEMMAESGVIQVTSIAIN